MKIFSFPSISNSNSKILILGTMPGRRSLDTNEYYAHRANTFWKIMFEINGQKYSEKYTDKKDLLLSHRIGIWDVLQACERESSADSDILNEVPNDFNEFLQMHKNIKTIFFNGKNPMTYFNAHFPEIDLPKFVLPSTSPANTWLTYDKKLGEWSILLKHI